MLTFTGCDNPFKKDSATEGGEVIDISTDTQATTTAAPAVGSTDLLDDPDVNKKIDEINAYINAYYYFDIDREKQEESLYDGIMNGLDDPYSVYYTPEEYADLMEDSSGEYVGIGAVVTQNEDKTVSVVRPIKGGPAEEVGLQAEDIIVEVDGTEINGQDLQLVVDMLRGTENTIAHIKVYRLSEGQYIDFDIPRRVVENISVEAEMLDKKIAYIQVQQFYDNTDEEFIEAVDQMLAQGAAGIIIDLRDNPGGMLDTVCNMCSYIMDGGVVVTTKDRNDRIVGEYKDEDPHSVDVPMVVLVNGNSASASEIYTGAMKDTGKAIIVGTTTYGKGIVQSIIPLSDGSGMKITVAKYFTPGGNDIHKLGIEPDYTVELADGRENAVNLAHDEDAQLLKAMELLTN